MSGGLTPFATAFMGISMTAVTCLAGWCMYRILSGPKSPQSEDD